MPAAVSQESGRAEFAYAGERPWHGLGTQVPGLMTTKEGLVASGLDWETLKLPLLSSYNLEPINGAFSTHRSDTMRPLGVVGAKYEPINNIDAFAFFDDILGEGQGQIETVGALGNGEKVFMMARLPDVSEIVKGDPMETFLLVHTSHDGSSAKEVMFTNIRVVCQNTLTAALRNCTNRVKIRHTKNWKDRTAMAVQTLSQSKQYFSTIQDVCKQLARESVTRVEVGAFLDAMFPQKEDSPKKENKNRLKVEELIETGMGTDIPGVKGTKWGLLNAYTEWQDHYKNTKNDGNNWERSVFGSGYNSRQNALDTLMAV